jgi:hypothetical protein
MRAGLHRPLRAQEMIMKKVLAAFVVLVPLTCAAYTEGDPITGIQVSTDPERAAEVERRAQEIAAHQQEMTSGTSGTSGTSAGSATKPEDAGKASTGHKDKRHNGHKGPSDGNSGGSGQQ